MYKVILVEDEKLLRENIKKSMPWERYGFTFAGEAANGEKALEVIENTHPNVIITDIKMPFMNGIELSKILKTLYPKIKIIILSGYADFSFAQEAIKVGVREYITKPVTPSKLISALLELKEELDLDIRENATIKNLISRINKNREESKTIKAKDLLVEQPMEKDLVDFLKYGSIDKVDEFINNSIEAHAEVICSSDIYSSYFGINMLITCMQVIKEFGGDPEKVLEGFNSVNDYVDSLFSPEEIRKETRRLITAVVQYRNRIINSSNQIIDKAKDYIIENMSLTRLTLNDVADYVGLSPNHFSLIFKQKTGCNFIKYLTEIRVKKAKELLRTTSMTCAEVAKSTGYDDPNYFSSVFKRNCGITTKQYRSQIRII